MTNKEILQGLSPEELVCSPYFVSCPYGALYLEAQKREGNIICKKEEKMNEFNDIKQMASFVFSGQQREICNACKLKCLSMEA